MDKSEKIANTLIEFLELQPDTDKIIYLRRSDYGGLVTELSDDRKHLGQFYMLKKDESNQFYFMLGYPAAFLAKLYLATKNQKYLKAAKWYLDTALSCNSQMYRSHFSHKIAWAAAWLGNITGEEKYKMAAKKIAEFLCTLQNENGLFLGDADVLDKYDQSGEISIWLKEISGLI